MDQLNVAEFRQLKAFVLALEGGHFKIGSGQDSVTILVDGIPTPVSKVSSLQLLRSSFPELQKEELKDDNSLMKYLSDPIKRNRLLERLTPEQQRELAKALADKPVITEIDQIQPSGQEAAEQQVPVGTATNTTGGVLSGMPSAASSISSTSFAPRRVLVAEQPVSGMEGGPGQGTAATNKAQTIQQRAEIEKVGAVTAKANRLAAQTAAVQAETPQASSLSSPSPRRFNPSAFRSSASSVFKKAQGLASPAGPFMKVNMGRVGRGIAGAMKTGLESANPFLGRMGIGLANNLSRIAQPGIGGGSRSFFGRFGGLGRGGSGDGGGVSVVSKAKGRGGLVFAISLIGFMLLVGGLAAIAPGSTPGEAAPAPVAGNPNLLNYTLPLKDSSVQPLDIKDEVKKAFPSAKLEYWDLIIQKSKDAGWNPALLLALWIEETGASQATLIANGGGGVPFQGNLATGHMGCAPGEDQTIEESLTCVFKMGTRYNFTNDQFPEFMAKYSGGPTDAPFSNNPNFTTNFKKWYSLLVPSGVGAIQAVSTNAVASCPIPNGKIGCASYGRLENWGGFGGTCRIDITGNGGHCNQNYKAEVGICGDIIRNGNLIRTAKSIDVSANSKPGDSVYLPKINGQKLKWKYLGAVSAGSNFGWIRIFHSIDAKEGEWSIHFVHVNQDYPGVKEADVVDSDNPGASILDPWMKDDNWPHVHITVGLNVGDSPADLKDYSPNWKFADRDLGMCTNN